LDSWAAVWAASISPFILILIAVIIYGLMALSKSDRKQIFEEIYSLEESKFDNGGQTTII